ncbi:MAG: glycoside hydrolase family 15 protein [Bacteroidales bacterium]|jgi:GH15 family glucan-1,4-alpha-glucosidase|nr:glycoside hydrolase family 15 protein [Bacteroidales bacterium]
MDNLDYGIIGNCKSAALISRKGSMDWCCLPEFDSTSVFAKILDQDIGGSFEILVDNDYEITQSYIDKTNILVTKFHRENDRFEVVDFMPRYKSEENGYYSPPDVIRYIKYISGEPVFRVKYDPRLEYAKYPTQTILNNKKYIKSYTKKGNYNSVYLYTDLDFKTIVEQEPIRLTRDAYFLLSYNQKILEQSVERAYLKLERTKVYWLNWSERTRRYKKYNDEILRSALVLKLLSYNKTGAVLAAVTTSLPETLGEIRNWDYRFCWIRDASMVIKVMTSLGHYNVARRYLDFVIDIIPDKDEKIQIMYGINREKKLTETILEHLAGYEHSAPVRVGNDAYRQKQNDIYGILVDVIYQHFSIYDTSLQNSEELWTIVRSIVKIVKDNWKKPDRGIWEIRTDHKHFTFSKVLCWVAVDRAIKIAQLVNMNEYVGEWRELSEEIKNEILEKAWNQEVGAFTQSYESDDLDASTLLMEPYGFIDAKDPRYMSTVRVTRKQLCRNGLMYRYKNKDDFGKPSSSFTICTFWLINSLYRIGEKDEAEKIFQRLLSYSNHLGLFSEDIDFETKRLLGNFPQAYSHLALIETAVNISGGTLTKDEKIIEAMRYTD